MPMTIQQLRDELNDLCIAGEGETEVKFAYNYGDYWRSTVASSIDAVTEVRVKYSEYHSMDKVVDDDRDEDEVEDDKLRKVFILE